MYVCVWASVCMYSKIFTTPKNETKKRSKNEMSEEAEVVEAEDNDNDGQKKQNHE